MLGSPDRWSPSCSRNTVLEPCPDSALPHSDPQLRTRKTLFIIAGCGWVPRRGYWGLAAAFGQPPPPEPATPPSSSAPSESWPAAY